MNTDKMKQAQRLKLDAALDCTRLKPKMRKAVRLVILDGLTMAEAARRAGVYGRADVFVALKRARAALKDVETYMETL